MIFFVSLFQKLVIFPFKEDAMPSFEVHVINAASRVLLNISPGME